MLNYHRVPGGIPLCHRKLPNLEAFLHLMSRCEFLNNPCASRTGDLLLQVLHSNHEKSSHSSPKVASPRLSQTSIGSFAKPLASWEALEAGGQLSRLT